MHAGRLPAGSGVMPRGITVFTSYEHVARIWCRSAAAGRGHVRRQVVGRVAAADPTAKG